ncbi:MAG TPA: pectinesterase family protein [Prolixibacteraceae bacterium]|nr:pectinesterase family protein [Prolixibacteraceae bacterium]
MIHKENVRKTLISLMLTGMLFAVVCSCSRSGDETILFFPEHKAVQVNPDTHLELTFPEPPVLGSSGKIRVYDAADNRLVDCLDLCIPPGPTTRDTSKGAVYTPVPYEYLPGRFTNANTKAGTPSGLAFPTSDAFQLSIIGNFTDGFHFYPVLIFGNKAIITLHHNLLEYGKRYYVQIDPGVLCLPDSSFSGVSGKKWTFSTKPAPPPSDSHEWVVSADGTGDFNTVQGAIDFLPDTSSVPRTLFVRNGTYDEIVYFRNKENLVLRGESREGVVIRYANNEVFNPHPVNLKTNEVPGTFPSRRAVFAMDHCRNIRLENLTIQNLSRGQAEGLLVNGSENSFYRVTIIGSGDALQTNGSAYYSECLIVGDGDTVLGRGPAFFRNCELRSYWVFMWVRNTNENHGLVFVNCLFRGLGEGETEIARCPVNHGKTYPYSEVVLIDCRLLGISPVGWGSIGGDTEHIRYWEYNSIHPESGKPLDISQRHPASKQLTLPNDSLILAQYRDPSFVLDGWLPE